MTVEKNKQINNCVYIENALLAFVKIKKLYSCMISCILVCINFLFLIYRVMSEIKSVLLAKMSFLVIFFNPQTMFIR